MRITAEGDIDHIYMVQSSLPDLDQLAVDAVKKWKFEPCKDSNGSAVATRGTLEMTFRLRQ